MADIPITLTLADYSRLMPLVSGEVAPAGIALRLLLGRRGSWADRAEMLRRALHDPALDGGEQSMAGHLIRIDRGDRSHVALPVFPLRNFTGRDLYVRKGSAVRDAGESGEVPLRCDQACEEVVIPAGSLALEPQ